MNIPKTILVSGTEYMIVLDSRLAARGLAGEIE